MPLVSVYLDIRLKNIYLFISFLFLSFFIKAQCPQFYDSNGNLTSTPYWIDCNGSNYTLNLQSNSNFGPYTIIWGDASSNTTGASYTSPASITHIYNATTDTFVVKIITATCTITGVVVMETAVNAGIQIPTGVSLITCAPKNLQFTNASTNVSKTTKFVWNFGDGSTPAKFNYLNAGTNVSHNYSVGTVNCQTAVSLSASNYCTFSSASVVNYSPIKIYDKDLAQLTASVTTRCWPDNTFQYLNTTTRNCITFGNTNQRYEQWNLGDHWGRGYDSLIGWRAWPPALPVTVAYPAIGNYTITMLDSSLCGIVTKTLVINVINKPTSLLSSATNTVCQGLGITFTNSSATGQSYNWNYGTNSTYQSLPYGPTTFSYTSAGNYTVSLVTFIAGLNAYCSDTSKLAISVKPKPIANFTYSPIFGCDNSSVNYTDLSTGIINGWQWNFGNGNSSNVSNPPGQSYSSVGQYTISLIAITNNGCQDSLKKTYNVYQSPVANFTANTTCRGYNTSFSNTTTFSITYPVTSHNWNFGDGSSINNSTNPIHTYSVAGTYTVTLTELTAYCSSTKTISLIVNQKPTSNYTASNFTVCPNSTITFTNTSVNANSYQWFTGTGITYTTTNTSETYTNSSQSIVSNTVTLIAQTTLGCYDTIKKIVKINPAPKASYTSTYTPNCGPVTIKFNNTTIGGTTYLWNFNDASTSASVSPLHSYSNTTNAPNTYSVSLTAYNAYGCKDSVATPFIVYPEPIYNFTPTNDIGCAPKSMTFTTVAGAVNYLWDFGDGSLFSGSNVQTHIYLNPLAVNDTFQVKLIATNPYNCKDTAFGQVIVKPSPKVSFGASSTSGCADLQVSFTNSSTNAISHQWYFGDGATSNVIVPNHTFTNTALTATNYPVALVVASSNGCKDSAIINIAVYPKANYIFTIPKDTGCSNLTVPFASTSGAVNYLWNFGDGVVQNAFNPTHIYSTSFPLGQTFTISVLATSPYGCQNTYTATIFAYPKPTASFNMSDNAGCAPLFISFNNTSVGATNYQWYYGDGATSNTLSPTHVYQNSGAIAQNYAASLVATDANGCKDSIYNIINVYPQALYNFQLLPDSGCTPLLVNIPTAPGATFYLWNFGDGQAGNGANPQHTFVNNTSSTIIYSVSLIASNSYGCKDTTFGFEKVFPRPLVNFSAGPITQTYPSATISFNNSSSTGYNYAWSLGDGTTANSYTLAPYTYTTWGQYSVKLVVSSDRCSDSASQKITIIPPIPISNFIGSKKGCQPLEVSFTNKSIYATSYVWDFGDGNTTSVPSPTHIFNIPGTFTISLTVYGPGGTAIFKKNDSVTVYQKPFAYFIANPLLVYVPNDPVYFVNQSQNAISYAWDFGDGNTSTEINPVYKYKNYGKYQVVLIATSSYGCLDTFKLADKIKADAVTGVEVPNAFTPNPSGPSSGGVYDPKALNNDIFHPNLSGVVDYEIVIYNKWGELLFSTTDQSVGWDGYYKGKLCPEDTYIYKMNLLTVDAKQIQKAGDFLLIR